VRRVGVREPLDSGNAPRLLRRKRNRPPAKPMAISQSQPGSRRCPDTCERDAGVDGMTYQAIRAAVTRSGWSFCDIAVPQLRPMFRRPQIAKLSPRARQGPSPWGSNECCRLGRLSADQQDGQEDHHRLMRNSGDQGTRPFFMEKAATSQKIQNAARPMGKTNSIWCMRLSIPPRIGADGAELQKVSDIHRVIDLTSVTRRQRNRRLQRE
jgi:hypothetical protein